MTKNQVNYLLVLATLIVVWLYFNTFFVAGMISQRATQWGMRSPASMMGQRPNFGSFAPGQYPNPNLQAIPANAMNFAAEIQKLKDAEKASSNAAAGPVAVSETEKKT